MPVKKKPIKKSKTVQSKSPISKKRTAVTSKAPIKKLKKKPVIKAKKNKNEQEVAALKQRLEEVNKLKSESWELTPTGIRICTRYYPNEMVRRKNNGREMLLTQIIITSSSMSYQVRYLGKGALFDLHASEMFHQFVPNGPEKIIEINWRPGSIFHKTELEGIAHQAEPRPGETYKDYSSVTLQQVEKTGVIDRISVVTLDPLQVILQGNDPTGKKLILRL